MSQKKDPPERIEDDEIWDEFWHAGQCGGSVAGECKHGITFFDANGEHMEEGELEGLTAKAAANPERFVAIDGGTHMTEMMGTEWHWTCQKCRAEALKYQEFIWGNRYAITRFLNARLKKEAEDAARELKEMTINEPK